MIFFGSVVADVVYVRRCVFGDDLFEVFVVGGGV